MALPTSRNTSYAPGSQVLSADLNAIQDQIVANNTRLSGGAGAAVALAIAPTAPDYKQSTARHRIFAAVSGHDGVPGGAGAWDVGAYVASSTVAGVARWDIPIVVESGETITITVPLYQQNAVGGGSVELRMLQPGTGTSVVVVAIASTAGARVVPLVTDYAVVSGAAYHVVVTFGAGAGTKSVDLVDVAVRRL